MERHLPWINHLAAREVGLTLIQFAELPPDEQREWKQFVLRGPSRLRDTVMIAQIRNMFQDFMTGSKTLTPVDEEWIDGILQNPKDVLETVLAEARQERKAQLIRRARALHERESLAEAA